MTTLLKALGAIGDAARLQGRALPVITTDLHSAWALRHMIEDELGGRLPMLPVRSPRGNYIVMYDGVAIEAREAQK